MTFREPLGVVALITPWNFPLTIASWKVAPALAAGNTVVLKPAELTPLTSLELERIALEAGLPEGVLNVVAGPGLGLRAAAGGAPRRGQGGVHRLDRGGPRRSPQGAAGTIKRVTLELGGKSANVVFADADLEQAAAAAPRRGVRQRRAGLLRALAHPRGALGARPLHGAPRGGGRRDRGGRPARRVHRDGPADLRGPPADGGLATCRTTRRWRSAAPPRTARATGSRPPCSARWPTTTAPRARRSSGRWRA